MEYRENTPLAKIIDARVAAKFSKTRDITTIGDLLAYWPRKYLDPEVDLSQAEPGDYIVAVAEVRTATTHKMRERKGSMLKVTISDGSTELDVTFFKPYGHERKLVPGAQALFAGEVSRFGKRLQLTHPGYTMLNDFDRGQRAGIIPIYRQVGNLHTWTVTECVRMVLDLLEEPVEPIPQMLLSRRGLGDRLTALRGIHTPTSMNQVYAARQRLAYEEALVLQVVLAQRRAQYAADATVARAPQTGGLLDAFDSRLPFTLTSGQQEVGAVIAAELAQSVPMHRLLQGEVGSGKTVVALRAMLAVVDAGGQAVLLAPTEVLAAQHHRAISAMLGELGEGGMLGGSELGTRIALLTGSMSTSAKRRALLEIASGDAGIVIGTHALIQEHVSFQDLALVVVDEQHRFGVEQRDALRSKGIHPPHVLVMTATPIPRTVAMTVFGDMEVSTLRELPAGRATITTHVVPSDNPRWISRTWQRVAEEVRAGRQVYVVCPRIGADDDAETVAAEADSTRELASVLAVHETLTSDPVLSDSRIEMLHGRMSADDKDRVMREFAAGRIDVLVATTVIEVGVDVANATVIVVLDADRFGVSQLHQLRGRVGRGGLPGLCLLIAGDGGASAAERLAAVAGTTDGFELARVDLQQRREGDVLGARQSGGRNQLQWLRVLHDEDTIEAARNDAIELIAADPQLTAYPELARAVAQRLDEEQAAFLERG